MFEKERNLMVDLQIEGRGVTNKAILKAMRGVPRHIFMPEEYSSEAYEDHPIPIGFGQTISQPYVVALMLELVEPTKKKKLLEVGSGSGYLLAIASKLFLNVVGVEVVRGLYEQSLIALRAAKAKNVTVLCSDGYEGAKEDAPYDAIIVSCSCSIPPRPLLEQLAPGGILVAPVGDSFFQELLTVHRLPNGSFSQVSHGAVRFVPLVSPHDLG